MKQDVVLLDDTPLGDFELIADVAFVGGDSKGLAGILIVDALDDAAPGACLAIRASGEARVYRSSNPLEPTGGRGWRPSGRPSPTGFVRLGASVAGGSVRFLVDGAQVDVLDSSSWLGAAAAPGEPRKLKIGIFSRGVVSRWQNLIAGGADGSGPFTPDRLADWGDATVAEASLGDAVSRAKGMRTKPSRLAIHAIAASLDEAHRGFTACGDTARAGAVAATAQRLESELKDAARQIGELELHERAFARFRELTRGKSATAPDSTGIPGAAKARLDALKGKLKPLQLDFSFETPVKKPLLESGAFAEVVRAAYGALDRSREGALRIHVKLDRSSNDLEAVESERRVPVRAGGTSRLAELETERASLEKKLADEIIEAQARADVVRAAARLLGPRSLVVLKSFQIAGRSRELHVDDGKALAKLEADVAAVKARIRKEGGSEDAVYRSIPSRLHTSSISIDLSYSVTLDGKTLLEVSRERTYLGIEQWSHPAHPATGTPESRFSEDRVRAAVKTVEDRALARFRTAISRDNLLSKLEPGARLGFLARLARSTGEDEDRTRLEWYLRSDLGLEGLTLERVAKSLSK